MSQERRAHRRYQIHLNAEVRDGARSFTAVTRDLSSGGTCIESAYGLPEGAEIDLSLFVVIDGIEDIKTPPLATRAQVQWAVDTGEGPAHSRHMAGLKFVGLTREQAQWLDQVIGSLAGPNDS